MKIYIAKNALTVGIECLEAEESTCVPGLMISGDPRSITSRYFRREGKDWHRTLEEAKVRAEDIRQRRIKALDKELVRLRALRVELVGQGTAEMIEGARNKEPKVFVAGESLKPLPLTPSPCQVQLG